MQAFGLQLEDARAFAAARVLDRAAGSFENQVRIVACDVLTGACVCGRALPCTNHRRFLGRHRDGVLVVLDDANVRKFPQRSHIHDFVEGALVHRAVAVVAHRDARLPLHLARHGDAGARTHALGNDAAAEKVHAGVVQVHMAAAAA